MGLPLSTTPSAAAAYNRGLDAVMRVQSGAVEAFTEAVALDPDFALAHGALAMLGHEGGADVDVRASLAAARDRRTPSMATDRERSLVDVVGARVARLPRRRRRCAGAARARAPARRARGQRRGADHRVLRRDRRAAGGVGPRRGARRRRTATTGGTARCSRSSGRTRAGTTRPGSCPRPCWRWSRRPATPCTRGPTCSTRPVQHEAGLRWLDPWITTCGRHATHRAHFSWHAALHELATGDGDAVRRRYWDQLAPPVVTGVRGLVDSASLLWRCEMTGSWAGHVAGRGGARPRG